MTKGLIITLPRFDVVTEYFSEFSKEIIDLAKNKSIPIKELKEDKVTKNNTEKVLKKLNHKLIVFNGHGSKTEIAGHKNEIIISKENSNLLKNKIIYSRACEAAHTLGEEISKNNNCFIGYKDSFNFYADPDKYHNPLSDPRAKLFLSPSNLIPISILKGNTVGESSKKSKRQILKNIKKILRENKNESIEIAQALFSNYNAQAVCGNLNERL